MQSSVNLENCYQIYRKRMENSDSARIYTINSDSNQSATIGNVVLSENNKFRKILHAELVRDSVQDPSKIKISISTQRKKASDCWEDVERLSVAKLKAGECQAIHLDSETTMALCSELEKLQLIRDQGFTYGSKRFAIIPLDNDKPLTGLQLSNLGDIFKNCPSEMLEELASSAPPEIVRQFAIGRIQKNRQDAVAEFEKNLISNANNEKYWQKFFEEHPWIFGLGLDYKFLHLTQTQPTFRLSSIDGKGAQLGDFLMHSAASNFTVAVEIKTPATRLLHSAYRNTGLHAVYSMSEDLTGGIAQIQAHCRNFERESQDYSTQKILIDAGIQTINPKGILIIGTAKIELDDDAKRASFEAFRRNTNTPQIFTFDEILVRARHISCAPI